MKEHKLPKPAGTATDEELKAYAAQFAATGDRRVLAEEVLRLRDVLDKLIAEVSSDNPENLDIPVRLPKATTPAKAKSNDNVDDELI